MPAADKTKEQLEKEAKETKKTVEDALTKANLAQKSIDKLKPLIERDEAQIKHLEELLEATKEGTDKYAELSKVLAASKKSLEPLVQRLHDLQGKQQSAISDEAKAIKQNEAAAETLAAKSDEEKEVKEILKARDENPTLKDRNKQEPTKEQKEFQEDRSEVKRGEQKYKEQQEKAKAKEAAKAADYRKHLKPHSRTVTTDKMTQEELEKYEAKLDRDDEVAAKFGGKLAAVKSEKVEEAPKATLAAAPKADVAKFMKQNSTYYQAKMDAALEEFQKKMSSIQNEFKNDQEQAE